MSPPRADGAAGPAHLVLVGVSHRHAPSAIRERVAVGCSDESVVFDRLRRVAAEGIVLSTCARTEVLALVPTKCGANGLGDLLADRAGLPSAELAPHLERRSGNGAVRHLARIAAGLESVVVGEPEILGQVRAAGEAARHHGTCGPIVDQAVAAALRAGRRVRAETELGRGAVTFASAALELATRALGGLGQIPTVVVGAGRVGGRLAESLHQRGARVTIVNRSPARAEDTARAVGCGAADWGALAGLVRSAELVVTAITAPEPVIPLDLVGETVAGRPRPMVLLDLGSPPNVDRRAAGLTGVTLRTLADVDALRQRARDTRTGALEAAEAIVTDEVGRFERWRRRREVSPVITALVHRGSEIGTAEVAKAVARSGAAVSEEELRQLADRIVARLLDVPLRQLASLPDGAVLARSAARLFDLTEPVGAES